MADSQDLTAALAAIPQAGLERLRAAVDGSTGFVPGLLAWLEHAVDWELGRRAGFAFGLQGPRAAIDDREISDSLIALSLLTAQFRDSPLPEGVSVAPFLEAAAAILRAEVERPDLLQ